jgi:hypothetical protein
LPQQDGTKHMILPEENCRAGLPYPSPLQQVRQFGDVGGDAQGFGVSSHAAAFSLLPSVPRNGHRGSPSVQPPAAHFVLPVRPLRALIGGRPRGVGCCLRSNLGLLCKFALLALPHFFTLHRTLGSRGGDGLALPSFLDGPALRRATF